MSRSLRNSLIALGVLIVVIATWLISGSIHDAVLTKRAKNIALMEEYIRQKGEEHIAIQKEITVMKTDKKVLEEIIKYQKNNPQIIIQKYEIEHENIDNLSPSESFKLFTSNIRDYKSKRGHYSLERFK